MATSRKPSIRKDRDGWRITRPGYGFAPAEQLGPFDSWAAAVAALPKPATASASPQLSLASQPHASQWRWLGHTLYPMKIT